MAGVSLNSLAALDFRKIRHFVAVVEEGSISRAAERENIAQPALSVHIRQLEEDLSVRLFDRSAQGVQATPAGQHFYKLCLQLLGQLEAVHQDMLDFGGTVAGSIRAGVMPSVCRGPLAAVLAGYAEEYPRVAISIVESNSGNLTAAVARGELDFAICNRPASQTDLKLHQLFSDPVVLVSGPASALPRWEPVRLSDVRGLKLILPSAHHSLRRLLDKEIKSGAIRIDRMVEIDGLSATMAVVRSSDWATALPSVAVANDFDSDRLIINPVISPSITSDIYEIHATEKPLSLPAQRFVEMIEHQFGNESASFRTRISP